MEHFDNKNRTI